MTISYHDALKIIQQTITPLSQTQMVPLLKALHRISSRKVHAKYALPKAPMSLKEGYALMYDASTHPHYHRCEHLTSSLKQGDALRVSTGDTLPCEAYCVVSEEECQIHPKTGMIIVPKEVYPEQNIKGMAEDIAENEILLNQFEPISAYKITALSAQRIDRVSVLKKPRMSILSIGNSLASGEISNSNAMSLAARIIELGGEIQTIRICEEQTPVILEHLKTLTETSDLVITTGALSQHDAMRSLINSNTLTTLFESVKIAPAKPSALSLMNHTPILHLPGLPLACMLGFEMLGVPLLRHMLHYACTFPEFITCMNQKRFVCRVDCMSAIPGYSDGKRFVCAPYYEAGRLNILSQCNGFTLIDEGKEVVEEGEELAFFFF